PCHFQASATSATRAGNPLHSNRGAESSTQQWAERHQLQRPSYSCATHNQHATSVVLAVSVTVSASVDSSGIDAYLLCGTPRTGSTLLCGLLRSTDVAGRPESYFRLPDEQAWADRWQ